MGIFPNRGKNKKCLNYLEIYLKISNPNTPIDFQRLKRSSYKAQLSAASCLVAAHGAPISFEPKSDGREPIAGSQHPRNVEPVSSFCEELSSYTTNKVYETLFSFLCSGCILWKKSTNTIEWRWDVWSFPLPNFISSNAPPLMRCCKTGYMRSPEGTKHQIW